MKKYCLFLLSLPTWKCGLKQVSAQQMRSSAHVTSYLEVWIETRQLLMTSRTVCVTSYLEVWIETKPRLMQSLMDGVTSYLEVWIETPQFRHHKYD